MPLLYVVGDAIVSRDELRDVIQLRKLGKEFVFPRSFKPNRCVCAIEQKTFS